MSKLSKNILYNLVGQATLVLLIFVAVKYVFKQLGEDALGIIYFTATLNIVLISILDKSISVTTVREVSTHLNTEPEYIRSFIRSGSLFCWSVYLLFGILVYFGAPILIEKWVNLKSMDSETATIILQILGVASLSAFPRSFYASLLRGLQRMEFNNLIDVTSSGIQQFGIILILIYSDNLFYVVCWIASSYGINIIAYFIVSSHFFSIKSMIPGYSPIVIKRNWGFASNMVYVSMLAMIHNQAEKIMVSKWLPVGALGYYGFTYDMVSKAGLITSSIAQAALPSLSILFKAGDRVNLVSQYIKLQDLICFITVPLFAAIYFASLPLFTYLFNAEIANTLFLPITFLCFGFYLNGTLNLQYQLSLAVGKPDIAVRSNIYALFILPIIALLIYQFGLAGAGLSWVLFNLFVYIYAVPRVYRECIGMPVSVCYSHILKVFILVGLTYGLAWVVIALFGTYSILLLSITYAIATITFLTGAYFMISDELRRAIFNHFQVLRNRLNLKQVENISR